jgi:hypothetical protein
VLYGCRRRFAIRRNAPAPIQGADSTNPAGREKGEFARLRQLVGGQQLRTTFAGISLAGNRPETGIDTVSAGDTSVPKDDTCWIAW